MALTLLLGGARSGKSALAVRMAASSERPVVFVATAEARDDEMRERIDRHRAARPPSWTTQEEPQRLGEVMHGVAPDAFVVLDCLSLWVSNRIEVGTGDDAVVDEARAVAAALAARDAPAVAITNEVGLGIVPVNALARRYRDLLGRVNVVFVEASTQAYFVVAGRALPLQEPTFA